MSALDNLKNYRWTEVLGIAAVALITGGLASIANGPQYIIIAFGAVAAWLLANAYAALTG